MSSALRILCLLLIAACLPPGAALADRCDVNATPLSFGAYNPLAPTPATTTGTLSVICAATERNTLPIMVLISTGNSGSFASRQMTSGGPERMNYNIYTSAAYSSIWGDGSGGSTTVFGAASKTSPFTATMFALAPPLQNLPVGTYRDSVTVTVLW